MISQKTKYAIKALIHLAKKKPGQLERTADISKAANVPKKFLEQILLDLKRAGIVASVQGPKGGYYLIKDAKKINLVDIHRLFEGPVAMVPCVSLNFYQRCKDCPSEKTCALNWGMALVRDKTLAAMKRFTVASLAAYEK